LVTFLSSTEKTSYKKGNLLCVNVIYNTEWNIVEYGKNALQICHIPWEDNNFILGKSKRLVYQGNASAVVSMKINYQFSVIFKFQFQFQISDKFSKIICTKLRKGIHWTELAR